MEIEAFEGVSLEPGETRTVEILLDTGPPGSAAPSVIETR